MREAPDDGLSGTIAEDDPIDIVIEDERWLDADLPGLAQRAVNLGLDVVAPLLDYHNVRVALALLILIGITTPRATSAPADEAQVAPAPAVSSPVALDGPPAIVLMGAAMLMLAGALRRGESSKFRG